MSNMKVVVRRYMISKSLGAPLLINIIKRRRKVANSGGEPKQKYRAIVIVVERKESKAKGSHKYSLHCKCSSRSMG